MKKGWMAVSAAALSVCMALGATACDGSAKSIVKAMEGQRVTAEQWAEAFSAENFKELSLTVVEESEREGKSFGENFNLKERTETQIRMSETIAYMSIGYEHEGKVAGVDVSEEDEEREVYCQKKADSDGYEYFYQDSVGEWDKVEVSGTVGGEIMETIAELLVSVLAFAEEYDSYLYSPALKGYVMKNSGTEEEAFARGVLKFRGGKLAGVYMEEETVRYDIESAYAVRGLSVTEYRIDYGTQNIQLPVVKEKN